MNGGAIAIGHPLGMSRRAARRLAAARAAPPRGALRPRDAVRRRRPGTGGAVRAGAVVDAHAGGDRRRRAGRAHARTAAPAGRGSSRSCSRPQRATTSSGESAPACSSRAPSTCSTTQASVTRLRREGLVHHGIELAVRRASGTGMPLSELAGGRSIVVYGQTEVVKDLIEARSRAGGRSCSRPSDVARRRSSTPTARAISFVHDGERASARVRRDRRLRRVPRHLPADDPGRGAAGLLARLPVRLARHPGGGRRRRTTSSSTRTTSDGFALLSLRSPEISRLYIQCRAGREHRRRGRTSGSGRELQARLGIDGWTLARGPGAREERHRHAQLRRRADAVRPALPGGRRRAHRAADGRQGPQPRDRATSGCWPRRSPSRYRTGSTALLDALLRDVPAPRLARRALLVVDDVDAAPAGGRDPFDLKLQLSQLRYVTTSRGGGDDARGELRRPGGGMSTNPADLGVVEASQLLAARSLSASELVEACLARIRERDGTHSHDGDPASVNAWVRVYEEDALAAAARCDERLSAAAVEREGRRRCSAACRSASRISTAWRASR